MYYISRGKVKPANRNFAAVRNDYTINLDAGCVPASCWRKDVMVKDVLKVEQGGYVASPSGRMRHRTPYVSLLHDGPCWQVDQSDDLPNAESSRGSTSFDCRIT